jgi:hypothetical protein
MYVVLVNYENVFNLVIFVPSSVKYSPQHFVVGLATGNGLDDKGVTLLSPGKIQNFQCKIWGFHGGDYEEWCLLGCYTVWLL